MLREPSSNLRRLACAPLALCVACGEDRAATIRLADLLERASIESPLTEIPAARSLADLDVPRHEVFSEDFESVDEHSAEVWARQGARVADVGGRRALQLHVLTPLPTEGVLVPVQPRSHYVFERTVRCDEPLDADIAAVESMPRRGSREAEGGAGRKALRMHWPEPPAADGSWQRSSYSFFTDPNSRTVEIAIRATPEGQRQMISFGEADGGRPELGVAFDDVRLERVHPLPRQTIALVKAGSLAEDADPELGMEKHGQLLPLGSVGEGPRPEDDSYAYRYALYAPPPTDLRFPIELPRAAAALRFSACLSRHTPIGDGARFELAVRPAGRPESEEILWTLVLTAHPIERRWHEQRVDLAPFAGQEVELVLRTRSVSGHPHPMWGNPTVEVPPDEDELRSVILIAVDTLRADRLSCYGHSRPTSPSLDALAEDGVRVENVAANANWTCPSFASIFTGLAPARHGVYGFGWATPLAARFTTLAERFRADGWATQAIAYKGSLYQAGYDQGFDVSFNVPHTSRAQENLDQALLWLDANAGRRNFLFLHFDDPHQPFNQPEPFASQFFEPGVEPTFGGRPQDQRTEAERDAWRRLYDGEVSYVDDRIGAFLAALRERGLYDGALIALVSDHGEELWDAGRFGHGRHLLHDSVVRVPLIVKLPEGRAAGRVVATQVRAFDVMPTLLELAGIDVEEGLDAESLVPLLTGDADSAPDRIAVTETSWESFALRNRRWKYISKRLEVDPEPGGEPAAAFERVERLFHLERDGERVDVAERHPDVLARMRVQVLDYLLERRPGPFLVVIRERGSAPQPASIEGVRSATTLFGAPGVAGARPASLVFEAPAGSEALAAVAALDVDGPLVLDGRSMSGEPERYRPGDLARLVERGAGGAYLFAGAPRAGGPGAVTVESQHLETLREVGYVGGDE